MSRAAIGTQETATTEPKALATRRVWEVDAWRGIAISTMVIYHMMWDFRAFVGVDVDLTGGFWFYFQRFTATSFIFLVGVSLVLSYNRTLRKRDGTKGLFWKYLQRGLKIFGIGMIISLVVRLAGVGRIDYGVLHFIGTAIVVAYPFLRFRWINLGVAALLYAISYPIRDAVVSTTALVWLGLEPPSYYYLDYFPLVHWFSVVLVGIFVGNVLYNSGQRQFDLPDLSSFFPMNVLQFLGRHSLLIYATHQILLMVVLAALGLVTL